MEPKTSFSTQALVILLIGNAVLIAVALLAAGTAWLVVVAGTVITLGLWLAVRSAGERMLDHAGRTALETLELQRAAETPVSPPVAERPRLEKAAQPPEAAAIQMLAILQRTGRLIDFLQEDIRAYNDAQIGAAVRNVHEGCRQALAEHVALAPVIDQPEGSTVTVEPGFNAQEIRLTGNVEGDLPFTGELRHRGWRIEKIDLPELMHVQTRVVAAAEVEV